MRNGETPSAVRILPADGVGSAADHPTETDRLRRRWLLPAATTLGALLIFVAATRPDPASDADATPTTTPPLLSAVGVETIDLTAPAVATTEEWAEVEFGWPGQIAGNLLFNGSLVAYGWDAGGANVWLSSTGLGWRQAPRVETPENAKSAIEHAVAWNRGIVAVGSVDDGVGLWTGESLSHWRYEGRIEMDGAGIIDLAAGAELLLLQENAAASSDIVGWTSSDGRNWNSIGHIADLDGAEILTLVASEGWYYAGGTERCDNGLCRPVIYRSRDGVGWSATAGVLPAVLSPEAGGVVDISTTADGLLAVGWAQGDEVTVWASASGDTWTRVAEDEPLLQPAHVTIRVRDFDLRSDSFAEIEIDGDLQRLAPNSEVITQVGTMKVTHVGPATVGLEWGDGSTLNAAPGDGATQTLSGRATSITSEGQRIVITGEVGLQRDPTAAVWYSADAGETWNRTIADQWRGDELSTGFIRSNHVVAMGQGAAQANRPLVWHTTWDTSAAEAAGLEAVEAFFAALNSRDVSAVAAAVPATDPGRTIELPSLGGAAMHWWDESGRLDMVAVADTVAYLDALDTAIDVDDCTTRMSLGDTDSLRVSCSFTASSDLLATLSTGANDGGIEAIIQAGAVRRVDLASSPSATLWQLLFSGTLDATHERRSTIARVDNDGQAVFDPLFDASSAAIHLQLAREFTAGLLRPGQTKVIETVLGTMEWQWLEELPVPAYRLDWITAVGEGFVGLGRGEPGRWTEEFSLYRSTDGHGWTEMEPPPDVQSLWSPQRYGDGLIARAWRDDRAFLAVFDGASWSEVHFPLDADGDLVELWNLAVSGDQILALTGTWSEESPGPVADEAWLVGPDLVARRTSLPAERDSTHDTFGLVGSDEGFVFATYLWGSPQDMAVWHSEDGADWTLIAERTSIEDAAYVWDMQHHRSKYFVVGEGAESRCSGTGNGGQACRQLIGLWSSPDGEAWDQVLTTAGEPLAVQQIGSGELGMAAVGEEYSETQYPRPIYLSVDGSDWARAGNLALFHPDVHWWWASQPAVGGNTIIIPGATFTAGGGEGSDVPFVIVGRLVDR